MSRRVFHENGNWWDKGTLLKSNEEYISEGRKTGIFHSESGEYMECSPCEGNDNRVSGYFKIELDRYV